MLDQLWSQVGRSNPLDEYQYTYDPVGNETAQNVTDQSPPTAGLLDQSLGYYNCNRLSYNYNPATGKYPDAYAYDSSGNQIMSLGGQRLHTRPGGRCRQRVVLRRRQRRLQPGRRPVRSGRQPDQPGQGGESGAVLTEKYDAWNRLVEVDDASGHPIETFTYDGTGRRVSASTYSGGTAQFDNLLLPQRPTGDPDRVRQCERRLHGRLPVRLVAPLHRRPDLPRHGRRSGASRSRRPPAAASITLTTPTTTSRPW